VIQRIDLLASAEDRTRSNMIASLLRRATDTSKAVDIFRKLIARASAADEFESRHANEQIFLAQHFVRSTMGESIYELVVEALKHDGYEMPSKPWL
jgi:hypothetical protein